MTTPPRRLSAKEKVRVLERHLLENASVSALCAEVGIEPDEFNGWQKELFKNGYTIFQRWRVHAAWASFMALLLVLPVFQLLRMQKATAEAAIGALLPFSAEATAEASDSAFGLAQARRNYAEMLDVYIASLARDDISSFLDIGKPAALKRELTSVKQNLESEEAKKNPAKAIRQAADKIYELYNEFATPVLSMPTLNRPRDGTMLVAISAFCTTTDSFDTAMKLKDASSSRKSELCELACLDSRRAFLVLLCGWYDQAVTERARFIDQFIHCENKTLKLTQLLAEQLSQTDPAKAKTLRNYARSMVRRLEAVQAMNAGDHAKVLRILKEPIEKSHGETARAVAGS